MTVFLLSEIFYRKSFDTIAILRREFPEIPFLLGLERFSAGMRLNCTCCYAGTPVLLRSGSAEEFMEDLTAIARCFDQATLIFLPNEEKVIDYFLRIPESDRRNIRSLLPSLELFTLFRDKYLLMNYCREVGIPTPRTYSVAEWGSLGVDAYPLLLKPRQGGGSRGIIRLTSPECITDDVRRMVESEPYLIQELLPDGAQVKGAFFLCRNGNVIGSYTHRRIRTSPPAGGVTVLSELDMNKEILAIGERLLHAARWDGIVMLEFLYDPISRQYKLIEANPRLWGSIMLAEYANIHILQNYVRLCLGEQPLPVEFPDSPLRIRWFFPTDLVAGLREGIIFHSDFWNFKRTCLINWSYANKLRALYFVVQSCFKVKNIKRLFRR